MAIFLFKTDPRTTQHWIGGRSSAIILRHFKLTIAYDGTAYGGWQRQPNAITVQQLVEQTLARIVSARVVLHGSGRTDAGVHARAQVASCSVITRLPPRTLRAALNAQLPTDIRVRRIQEVAATFHARFSATAKEYRYFIDTGAVADPFRRAYAWHHPRLLDVPAMRRAARLLSGRHNFRALSAGPARPADHHVRTISRLSVAERAGMVTIAVVADGFLYKMVRSIVGALVRAGEGRLTIGQLAALLAAKKRTALVETAPAKGLFLWRVRYSRSDL